MYKSLDKRQHLWHDIVLKSNEEYRDSCHCIRWSGSRLRDGRKWKHIFWARRIKLWNSLTQFRKATGFKTRFLIEMEKGSYLREWTTWNLLAQEVLKTTKDRIQESLWNIDLISYSVCLSIWTLATIRERDIRKMDYWAELLWQLRGTGHGKLFYVVTVETCVKLKALTDVYQSLIFSLLRRGYIYESSHIRRKVNIPRQQVYLLG